MSNLFKNNDSILANLILDVPKPIINSTKDVFHDLMSCVIEQQIHYRSTKKIFAKCLEQAGISLLSIDNFHLLEKYSLPQLKLAMNKYETMSNFISFWSENKLDFHNLTDEEVRNELSSINGIGKWTIDMILLYTLERPTIFPYDDFHLKQIMTSVYNLNANVKLKAQMLEIAENWGSHKSLAVLYLLEWKKLQKRRNNKL